MLAVLESGELLVAKVLDARCEPIPSMEPDTITVSVPYDSGSASQTEEGLAIRIEDQLEDVSGIATITRNSNGSGVPVTIKKQEGYALEQLLEDLKTRIDGFSTFPSEAENPILEKAEREEHALWLQLYGNVDRQTLQRLADNMKSDLLARDSISRVAISGRLDPQMEVELDDGVLRVYGVSMFEIEDAINQGSSNTRTAVLPNDRLCEHESKV